MKDWKKLGKKLVFLPVWLLMFLTVLCAAALVTVFEKGWEMRLAAYVTYVFSFYTLVAVCAACWTKLPKYYKQIKGRVYENPYANRYFTDVAFKTHMTLYRSLAINLLYVAVNVVSAVIYRSLWFATFAAYYAIMAMMRFLLARYVRKNQIGKSRIGELRRARVCAVILLTVNLTLSGVVLMMVYLELGFEYKGFLIYVMAMYTFYTTTTAVIELVKFRRYNSPVISVSKNIKLAASLFSMLFLETAMFAQFGEETPPMVKRIMIMATGGGISVIVVGMAVYRIVQSTKELRKESN